MKNQEEENTYPRFEFTRVLRKGYDGETVFLHMRTQVIDIENFKVPIELKGQYPFRGERNNDAEMEFSQQFHHLCKLAYDRELEQPLESADKQLSPDTGTTLLHDVGDDECRFV